MDLREFDEEQRKIAAVNRAVIFKMPKDVAKAVIYEDDVAAPTVSKWIESKLGIKISADSILRYRAKYQYDPVFDEWCGVTHD